MSEIRKVCVYCGSGPGKDPDFVLAARQLGKIMAKNGVGLVYGGGSIGLMGEIANAVLDNGGHVTGIIPDFLANREHQMHRGEIIRTRNMHDRKQQMFEHADAFVALPGGVGTLEEVVEQMTWVQLGRHRKPVGRLPGRRPDRGHAADAASGRCEDSRTADGHGLRRRRSDVARSREQSLRHRCGRDSSAPSKQARGQRLPSSLSLT
jgi:uncharacterized protein (TIGR00730 family)